MSLNDIFDPIVRAHFANDSGSGAESSRLYTFDGKLEKTINNITYARMGGPAPDLHTIKRAVYTAPTGADIEFLASELTVVDDYLGLGVMQAVEAALYGQTGAVILADPDGLWGYNQPGFGYCSLIEFDL
jgi:hypothetical protein